MTDFKSLRGFVIFYAAMSLIIYTMAYLDSFYCGENIEKKIAVKEGLLYLSFTFLLFGTSARRPLFMIPYMAIHLFSNVRSYFEMFHMFYLAFSNEDGYDFRSVHVKKTKQNKLEKNSFFFSSQKILQI